MSTGCPRTASPEKKGSVWVNVVIGIFKEKKVLSQAIIEKRHSKLDQSESSTIQTAIFRSHLQYNLGELLVMRKSNKFEINFEKKIVFQDEEKIKDRIEFLVGTR
jgi:hypothetical protein